MKANGILASIRIQLGVSRRNCEQAEKSQCRKHLKDGILLVSYFAERSEAPDCERHDSTLKESAHLVDGKEILRLFNIYSLVTRFIVAGLPLSIAEDRCAARGPASGNQNADCRTLARLAL